MKTPNTTMLSINEIEIGDCADLSKTLSESDIYLFAGITCDFNPIHVNEAYAQQTFFKGRIAHGMLLGGLVSAVLGTKLPGPRAIYVEQTFSFKAPARIGDTVTARVVVIDVAKTTNRVQLETSCTNQDGTLLLDGVATLSPYKPRKRTQGKPAAK